MKLSEKPTAFLLVKAYTNSEWDTCDFAIVHLSEDWKKQQAKKLEAVKPFAEDYNFQSLNYYDTAIDFYRIGEDEQPDIEELLAGKEWVFVELDKDEQETFTVPENSLDCYRLVVYKNGNAIYKAYGKHTSEEFWTEEFGLKTLCSPIAEETEVEIFCKERFKHLSNKQLVARVNQLPDFKWDDEGVELQRRRRLSNGTFDYCMKENTMIILKDEQP